MTVTNQSSGNGTVPAWHAGFMPMMPVIRRQVRTLFRHLPRQDRDEAIAEVTAVAMIDFLGRLDGNQSGSIDPTTLARSAAMKVLSSGRACGRESSRDVLSPVAQQRGGFKVEHLKDSCNEDQLGTRIALRKDGHNGSPKQLLEPHVKRDGSNGSLPYAEEHDRRCNAEHRVRTTDLEFQVARRIQQNLFPTASPVVPGFEIAGLSCPAEATGGDYFDYVPMLNNGVGVVVGDVSGHGFGPALLMASTRAYLRAFAQTHSDLGELLSLVNRVLTLDVAGDRFVTIILAQFDPRTCSLVYASAGHPASYVLNESGHVRVCLPSTGLPLGIWLDESFTASPVIQLQPGELVILLSDGVTESAAPDGTAFGWSRAVNIVRVYRHDPAIDIVSNLYHAVRAFCQNAPQLDDITSVVIKITKDNRQPGVERPRELDGLTGSDPLLVG